MHPLGTPREPMTQTAPYPFLLEELVENFAYYPGWGPFRLLNMQRSKDGCAGLTLVIHTNLPDAYHHNEIRPVVHYMIVPAASYDLRSWRRWLFDQIALIERHERMEGFEVGGEKPYAPSHGPGNDPYLIREVGTVLDVKTSFRGDINP